MESVNKYLERLIKLSKTELENHFKASELGFDRFETVNSYLIYQTIKDSWKKKNALISYLIYHSRKKENTLIFSPDKEIKSRFYIPTIYTLALYNFIDNYIDNITVYEVGDIVQRFGHRYKIVKKTTEGYTLEGSRLHKHLTNSQIKKYIITTADTGSARKTKLKFDLYKNFFKNIIREKIEFFPSKFKYKSIIVTDKSIVDELKKHKIDGEKIHKAFPFQYVTESGKTEDNIPIDPMIYIVNKYEVARKYILDKGIPIRNITFIGQNKYKNCCLEISEDLNNNRIENCLLIGSADVSKNAIPDLLRWRWTLPELDYFKYFESHSINKITVQNEQFTEYLNEFNSLIKQTEEEYSIHLSELYRFVRRIFPIIIPSPESRLLPQLNNTLIYFKKKGEDIVETALDEVDEYDYEDVWNEILEKFTKLIDCKKNSQLKFEKIKEFKKIDYLIVNREYLNIWREEINKNKIKNVISSEEFNNLDTKNKIIVFTGFFGYNHLKLMMYNSNKISIILYTQEEKDFDNCFNRLKEETYKELKKSDRKTISQIQFKETKPVENIFKRIKRLFGQDEHTEIYSDYSESDTINICRKLTFENDTEPLKLGKNKAVLLKINQKERSEKVKYLKVGDKIRIYDNLSKEELYKVALECDTDRKFKEIEKLSKLWKEELLCFYKENFNSLNGLYLHLVENGLNIRNENTLNNWTKPESNVKFPQKNKDLYVIKKTINSDRLNKDYKAVLKSRHSFKGVMISLGRNFSDEISDYIISKKKGELLKLFSEKQIHIFVDQNAKERTIKTIEAIDYEE